MTATIVACLIATVLVVLLILAFLKWVELQQQISDKDAAIENLKGSWQARVGEVEDLKRTVQSLGETIKRQNGEWGATEKQRALLDLRLRVIKFALECEDDKHLEHILDRRPIQVPFNVWANKSK